MRRVLSKILVAAILNIVTVICSVAQPVSGGPVDQVGKIEGSVANEKGEPIEFVTVILRQAQDSIFIAGTTTNAAGEYTFNSVMGGKYILTYTFVGYQKQSMIIELPVASTL